MATRKNALRAVKDGEVPVKAIASVLDASERGSRVDELVQIRRVIARAIDNENTSPRDLAALSRRQIEISKEIEALHRLATEEAEDAESFGDEAWDEEAI